MQRRFEAAGSKPSRKMSALQGQCKQVIMTEEGRRERGVRRHLLSSAQTS